MKIIFVFINKKIYRNMSTYQIESQQWKCTCQYVPKEPKDYLVEFVMILLI